ncbi:MAG TPA: CotH kinase family protein, partial [Bacillota bacterium]|nr:CotH kinase family protein [Bacillota bacterium]
CDNQNISEAISELSDVSPSPDEQSAYFDESRANESRLQQSIIEESLADESRITESIVNESLTAESIINESIVNESLLQESIVNESVYNESVLNESILNESIAEESRKDESRRDEVSREKAESRAEESRYNESVANDLAPVKIKTVFVTTTDKINKDEYVAARILITDPSGKFEKILDTEATIKVRGNSTSAAGKAPYNFKLTKKTSVYGMGESKKWCLLSNPYDKTLMRNKLSYDFARAIGIEYTSNCEYVDLYVNGTYVGNYLLAESIGVGEDRVDLDIENNDFLFEFEPWIGYSNVDAYRTPRYGVLLGYNDRDYPTEENIAYLNTFFTAFEEALHMRDYDDVAQYIDVDSFVNFYIVNELFKNVDFGTSSTRYYIKDGKLYAGPVWDLDLSAGNCSAEYYTGYNNVTSSGDSTEKLYCYAQWYGRLLEIPKFKQKVYARYLELQPQIVNLTTDNALGKNRIDRLLSRYSESFYDNYERTWQRIDEAYSTLERIPDSTYTQNVEYMRQWLIKRNAWLLKTWGLS